MVAALLEAVVDAHILAVEGLIVDLAIEVDTDGEDSVGMDKDIIHGITDITLTLVTADIGKEIVMIARCILEQVTLDLSEYPGLLEHTK